MYGSRRAVTAEGECAVVGRTDQHDAEKKRVLQLHAVHRYRQRNSQ